MRCLVFDYGGNLRSVAKAFGAEITKDPDAIRRADKIILPGQGAFDGCARALPRDALNDFIKTGNPLLGICVGMQLLGDESDEGAEKGLGWIPGRVERLNAPILPHIGWNEVIGMGHAYFSHSYVLRCDPKYVVAECDYGGLFPAIVKKDNITGVQFHPEKSGRAWLGNALLH